MRSLLLMFVLFSILALGCKLSEEDQKAPSEGAVKAPEAQPDKGKEKGRIVARVNGKPIYEGELGMRSVNLAVDDEILYDEALRQGLDKQYEYKVENYRKNLLIGIMKRDIYMNKLKDNKVSEEEIMEYYNGNQNEYKRIQLKFIAVQDDKVAEEIHKRAINGEDFDKIAEEYKKSDVSVTVKTSELFTKKYNSYFEELQVNSVSDVRKEGNENRIYKII
ncbi:MAG: peptidyl-prolyl cis-trans isomerase, partial [Thermodesulfobacteriota bacterium]